MLFHVSTASGGGVPFDRPGHSAWRTPSSNLSVSGGTPGPSRHMTLDSSVLDPCEFRDFRQLPNVVTHARFRGLASWFPHGRSGGETALWPASIRDLAHRLSPRVQLTTDGHKVYLEAVEGANGAQSLTTRGLVKPYEGTRASASRRPVTVRSVPRDAAGLHRWRSRSAPLLDQPRGATEPQRADGMRRFTGLTREVAQEHGGALRPAPPRRNRPR